MARECNQGALTTDDVVARELGVPALRDVRLLLVLRSADDDMNLKLSTLYHLHDTARGSKSARLTWAQPCKNKHKVRQPDP